MCSYCISKTGGCCTGVELALLPDEIPLFQKRFDDGTAPEGHTLELYEEETKTFLYKAGTGKACMYLAEDNSCSVYDERPGICRAYPLMWVESEYEGEDFTYFLDMACPLTHTIPLATIANWIELPLLKEKITSLGELDFDVKDEQYLNLTEAIDQLSGFELPKENGSQQSID